MIIIKKPISKEITAEIELSDETELFTRCQKCGKLLEATDEIIDDFGGVYSTAVVLSAKSALRRAIISSDAQNKKPPDCCNQSSGKGKITFALHCDFPTSILS